MQCYAKMDIYRWNDMVPFVRIWEFISPDQEILYLLDFVVINQQVRSIHFAFLSVKLFQM
jgi:hypothetical protein